MKHGLHCLSWSTIAALLGCAVVAYGQDPPAAATTGDPTVDTFVDLVRGGGLPLVLAYLAWWARGALGAGVPLVVQLHPDDRALFRRGIRAVEKDEGSESSDPPARAP